ncbi:hypothetical protein MMC22_001228 [Lobaria immixta]|nr:hypothetical protein [Lobaria immixta]
MALQITPTPTPTASSTSISKSAKVTSPVLNFETPVLTTTFTPPPSCTQGHITMLMSAAYQIWLNEPRPVPNTTVSDCYPPQFMTSFLASASKTILPAFSPLVCPDNYFTIYNQTFTSRPLYIACCPSGFGFHPPDTSTPGRPGYGGTCFSDILSVSVTQYDNSSSSGVMLFSTSGQAYAHPIDGFALQTTTPSKVTVVSTAAPVTSSSATISSATSAAASSSKSSSHTGLIAGLVIGLGLGAGLFLALVFFILRSRKRKHKGLDSNPESTYGENPPPWSPGEEAKELPTPPPVFQHDPMKNLRSELPDGQNPGHEMPIHNETPTELDGNYIPRR